LSQNNFSLIRRPDALFLCEKSGLAGWSLKRAYARLRRALGDRLENERKEHLANIEQTMYIILHLVAAGWMTATTVLPVRQIQS
jgi:hypothetical protein